MFSCNDVSTTVIMIILVLVKPKIHLSIRKVKVAFVNKKKEVDGSEKAQIDLGVVDKQKWQKQSLRLQCSNLFVISVIQREG